MTFGINGAELIILILLAVLVLGPEKLPEYTRKLTEWIRNLKSMAEGAKTQFRDETGTDFDEIDWRRYDPRQYDPRRIIREALAEPVDNPGPSGSGSGAATPSETSRSSPGTRQTLRRDLGAARAERETLREDLKDMDPRALFFGSSRARRTSADGAAGAASGAGSTAGAPDIASDAEGRAGSSPEDARDPGPTPSGSSADAGMTGLAQAGAGNRHGTPVRGDVGRDAGDEQGQMAGEAAAGAAMANATAGVGPAKPYSAPFDAEAT